MLKQPLLKVARDDMRLSVHAIQVHITTIRRDADVAKRTNVQESILAVRGVDNVDRLFDAQQDLD